MTYLAFFMQSILCFFMLKLFGRMIYMNGEKSETEAKKERPRSPINGQPIPEGRKKGTPNKRTVLAREAIAQFVDGNAHKLIEWLERVAVKDPAEAFKLYMSVVEYHIPKLERVEHVGKDGGAIERKVIVEYVGAVPDILPEVKPIIDVEAVRPDALPAPVADSVALPVVHVVPVAADIMSSDKLWADDNFLREKISEIPTGGGGGGA